jgi:hypothetical protein
MRYVETKNTRYARAYYKCARDISTTNELQLLEAGLNLYDYAIYKESYGKYLTYDAFYRMPNQVYSF